MDGKNKHKYELPMDTYDCGFYLISDFNYVYNKQKYDNCNALIISGGNQFNKTKNKYQNSNQNWLYFIEF